MTRSLLLLGGLSISVGLKALLQFAHLFGKVLPFFELPSSSDVGLDDSKLECSSSSECVEDELYPSFCLPLDFLEVVLVLDFFLSSSNYESICLRLSIDSC